MDNVASIQILKSIQDLFKVPQNVLLSTDFLGCIQISEITIKIFIIAILQYKIYSVVLGIAYYILNLDYIRVLA